VIEPRILAASDPDSIDAAVRAIRGGQIVAIPTETVYGLAVLPEEPLLRALVAAKRRPEEKGIAVLVDGLDQVEDWVRVPPAAVLLGSRFWPGALTLALPIRDGRSLPEILTGGRATLGVRVPDHPVPRAIARELGPIAVSSANVSGEPEATSAAEIAAILGSAVSVVLDDGPPRGGTASTVAGFTPDGDLAIFREGAIPVATLEAVLAERVE
jgi:L-threonylcarbamoyladenylate synthase